MADHRVLPTLFKKTSGGGTQEWAIRVEPQDDGTAKIVTVYGLQGGKKQEVVDHITQGKNAGKKNATTAIAQALSEAESRWDEKLTRKHYGRDVEASAEVRGQAPMLAQDYSKRVNEIDWCNAYTQPKLDGFRCLARNSDGVITLESREGKPIEHVPHVVDALRRVLPKGATFDGELYGHGLSFQEIAKRVKKARAESVEISYHIYDLLDPSPFGERTGHIHRMLRRKPDFLVPVQTVPITMADELMAFQQACIADGYEGAMLRHGLAAYEAGKRSKSLLKVKTFKDADFQIVDVREGRGTHAGMAIFVCRTGEATFEVTAPGTHDQKRDFWSVRATVIGRMLTVKFFEYTTSVPPVPRFPVALRLKETA